MIEGKKSKKIEIEKERLSSKTFLPSWVWLEHKKRFNFVAKLIKDKKIIDCACGNGTGSYVFSKFAREVHAFDISEAAISEAKEIHASKIIKFAIGNSYSLPVQSNSFDVYVSLETIEHLLDDRVFLQEVKRTLKAGGIFICSTPNRTVTNPGKKIGDAPNNKFHLREYSQDELLVLLKSFFNKVELYGQNPNSRNKLVLLNKLGILIPKSMVAKLNQFIKLMSYSLKLRNKSEFGNIKKISNENEYEYLVAICS